MLLEEEAHAAFDPAPPGLVAKDACFDQEKGAMSMQDLAAVAPVACQGLALAGHEHAKDRHHHIVTRQGGDPESWLSEPPQERREILETTANGAQHAAQLRCLARAD